MTFSVLGQSVILQYYQDDIVLGLSIYLSHFRDPNIGELDTSNRERKTKNQTDQIIMRNKSISKKEWKMGEICGECPAVCVCVPYSVSFPMVGHTDTMHCSVI